MTDERNDDEILGRALSRAIETQSLHETPFGRSRIADRPARRGFGVWRLAGATAALVLALAFGSWLTRPSETIPVAASPTVATNTPAATATPSPSPTGIDHERVYFARDGLPPVSAHFATAVRPADIASRIRIRLTHLLSQTVAPPSGAFTAVPPASVFRDIGDINVTATGDVNVDFALRGQDWGIHSAREASAFVQQIVYTASEEPGVRQVLITQNGGQIARIDQLVLDKPLAREDVSGYPTASVDSISGGEGNDGELPSLITQWYVDSASPGLARFVIQVGQPGASAAKLPLFRVDVTRHDDVSDPASGKWRISVTVSTGADTTTSAIVDQTPLRSVQAYPTKGAGTSVIYGLELDDLRPWRAYTQTNPGRIVIDVGGPPQSVNDRIAVYAPAPASTIDSRISRTFTVAGAARVFEANVMWRVKDSTQKVVATGHTLASLGTSAVWGTFSTQITLPSSVTGSVTLEVYEVSPKDGSDQGVVSIPLAVR